MIKYIFFIFLFIIQSNCDIICDPIELSFKLCNSDTLCSFRLFINENGDDLEVFEFLYNHITKDIEFQNFMNYWLCAHNSAISSGIELFQQESIDYNSLDEFYKLWIRFMSEHRECDHTNQYFDSVIKSCVCKQDKQCTYIHPHDMEFHSSNYRIIIWILLFLIIFFFFYFVKKAKSLKELLDKVSTII